MSIKESISSMRQDVVRARSKLRRVAKSSAFRTRYELRRIAGLDEDIQSIIGSYQQMLADNRGAPPMYTAGLFWEEINHQFSPLIYSGAIKTLRNQYFNRRFSGPQPASMQVYTSLNWLYYQTLLPRDVDGYLKRGLDPAPGGTGDQVIIDGRPMSVDFLQSVDEAFSIRDALKTIGATSPRVIIELGAGYGRLANVCREIFPECSYVILDLPEALLCSSTWLAQTRPGEVVPYAESRTLKRLDRELLASKPIWTLGAQQIENLSDGCGDVFVNAYSFAEMPVASIENYFSHIDRLIDGVFYTKQRREENNVVDNVTVTPATYPVRERWTRLSEKLSTLYEAFFEATYRIPRGTPAT